MTFSALVAVGDGCGRVGLGLGRSAELADAIQKAGSCATKEMLRITLAAGTIPHRVCGRFCGAEVSLWPASPGTGLIAGKAIRAILGCAGVRDAVAKSMGSTNVSNVAKAALKALMTLRLGEAIYRDRGIKSAVRKKGVVIRLPDTGADPGGVGWN